jgi:circadian clock protein KaiC
VVENILFLRYREDAVQRSRVLSILKLRESGYDPTLRPFLITEQGIVIARAADGPGAAPDPPPAPDGLPREDRGGAS